MNFDRLEIDEDYGDTVLPLVLCRSRGGPYEDDAFVSGWRLGGDRGHPLRSWDQRARRVDPSPRACPGRPPGHGVRLHDDGRVEQSIPTGCR